MSRWFDLVERSAWTFAQAFAASIVVGGELGLTELKIALGAAIIAVLKNLSVDQTVRGQMRILDELTPKDRREGN